MGISKEQARRILENSKRNSVDEERLIEGIDWFEKESGNEEWIRMARKKLEDSKAHPVYCYLKVGGFVCTNKDDGSQCFICWPYSDEDPLDETCAFGYRVYEDGTFESGNAPLNSGEARRLYRQFFPAEAEAGEAVTVTPLPETERRAAKSRPRKAEAVA